MSFLFPRGRQIFFFFLAPPPNHGFILTSPFTVLALIKVINASTYKPNIRSHTIPLCPSRTTKTRCLVVSVGALLPLPFDLAMSTLVPLSHFVPHEQPRLVAWLFRWEHCCPSLSTWRYSPASLRRPSLVKLPSLPGHGRKAGGLGAILRTFPSAVAL